MGYILCLDAMYLQNHKDSYLNRYLLNQYIWHNTTHYHLKTLILFVNEGVDLIA